MPSTLDRESMTCHGMIAIVNAARRLISLLFVINLVIIKTGNTTRLPKKAAGNRTANSVTPKIYVASPERYIGPMM